MMELTEDFLKLLQIAFIVIGVLAIFFTYIQYNIFVSQDKAEREAIILGNSLLSSDCLTYLNTKSLFSEEKLESVEPSCFSYPYGSVKVELLDLTKKWEFVIETSDLGGKADSTVAVKLKTGEIKTASMTVKV